MSLSFNIDQHNYTNEVTPKSAVANPIHVYFSALTDNNYDGQHSFYFTADLTSYDGTASMYYPYIRVDLGKDPVTDREGFVFERGCGTYENVSITIDNNTYTSESDFSRVNLLLTASLVDMSISIVDTNLPIIYNEDGGAFPDPHVHVAEWEQYSPGETHITDLVIQNVVNFREYVPEDYTEYWTKVTKGNYTISQTGKSLNGVNSYAWETIRVRSTDQGKLAWAVSSDGKTATLVRTKTVISDVWSDSRGNHWEDAITPHFTTLPYEWDGVTYGTYDIATSFKYGIDTNIPIFDNRDIQGYIDGEKSEEDSIGYPGNKTGEREDVTDFPDVTMSMNSVSSLIAMNSPGLSTLNASLNDLDQFVSEADMNSGIILSAITGTTITAILPEVMELMNIKAIDMFNSVIYFPFDITTVATTTSITKIYSGIRKIDAPTGSKLITANNGFLNLGSVTVTRSWFDYRDLTNMRCKLYLPYIGYRTLNLNEVLGKSVNVRYYIDFYSGSCVAVITANNRMIDYAQGIIGVNMGVSPDSSNGLFNSTATIIASVATQNYLGVATGAIGAVNELSMGNSSCPANGLGLHLPQYAFFVFESDNINETSNEILLDGKPSDVSGSVGSFSGYLKVKSVDLHCGRATEKEKQKIKSLLYSGIYI